ncbi:MAG: response regulator [Deltaproteobacteria bacterium]|nr:response regulator [Deltaproteobacteria bacterium]
MGADSNDPRNLASQLKALRQQLDEERRSAETQRERAGQYERLFNRIVDAVIIHDKETHRILYWNDTVLRIYGYSEDELRAMRPHDLHPPEDLERVQKNIHLRNVDQAFTYTHLTKSGQRIDVEILTDELEHDGRPAWISVVRDITERRQLENQLLHSQKMEAVGTLAGGVAHDMNNVLAGILSYATLLATDTDDDDPRLADVQEIIGLCRRGRDLARNLLGYARKGQYRHTLIAAEDLVSDVRAILERTIPRRIELRTEVLGTAPPYLTGDPGQLSNALMNVCLNGVDAMEHRGVLTISSTVVELDARQVAGHESVAPGSYVRLQVRDTGTGMPAEVVNRVFEPFFTTKAAGTGSGLGLAMVYGTLHSHEGFVALDSTVGEGTTVSLYVAAAEAPAVKPTRPISSMPPPSIDGGVILLVDDERSLRKSGKRLLELLGYEVLLAADGRAAVEQYRQHGSAISLVILDLSMPVMDGFETLECLREMAPDIRVLISTGYSPADRTRAVLEQGHLEVLEKPFNLKSLSRSVHRALGRSLVDLR